MAPLSELQRLSLLETLVRLVKKRTPPGEALAEVVAKHGEEARKELASFSEKANVTTLVTRLHSLAGSIFSPKIVSEAADLLSRVENQEWLGEIGRRAKT